MIRRTKEKEADKNYDAASNVRQTPANPTKHGEYNILGSAKAVGQLSTTNAPGSQVLC